MFNPAANFLRCVRDNNLCGVGLALAHGANMHIRDDTALRFSIANYHFEITEALLECGANIHCCDNIILKEIQKHFYKRLAVVILPYCDEADYHYFSDAFIADNVRQTKSAGNV